jgi:hypothetical protein
MLQGLAELACSKIEYAGLVEGQIESSRRPRPATFESPSIEQRNILIEISLLVIQVSHVKFDVGCNREQCSVLLVSDLSSSGASF